MAGTGFSFFSKKQETIDNVEEQIKVLATNIEVLNQKLITDPNAAITPGEAIIKKQLIETIAKLEYVENFLRTTQTNLSGHLLENAKVLQQSFLKIQKNIETIPQERNALREEIVKLETVVKNLNKLDREWLQGLLTRIEILNKNMQVLNDNLGEFYKNMSDEVKKQFAQLSEEATSKVYKSMVWFVVGIAVLTFIFTLLFAWVGKSLMG
jgi:hypothetical protein